MREQRLFKTMMCMVLGIGLALPAVSEQTTLGGLEALPVPSRVVEHVDNARTIKLAGGVYPLARTEYERGRVAQSKLLERIVLVLKRSPEQEAALAALNERQYDPKSADFHRWLHAEEFGKLFGPSETDIDAVTSWLSNHGFQVVEVSKGRLSIQFTGTVQQVEDAFHLEMHEYMVGGQMHIANDRDASIPEALTPAC